MGFHISSKVVNEWDFRQVEIPPELIEYSLDPKRVEDEMLLTARKKGRFIEIQAAAEKGDIVTCILSSRQPKWDKGTTTLNVGLGLLSAELEQQLLGMIAGEKHETDVDGYEVEITLLEVRRHEIPELTDNLIAELAIDGVSDVASYKEHLYQQLNQETEEKKRREVFDYVMNHTLERSEFDIHDEDVTNLFYRRFESLKAMYNKRGLSLESLTEDEFKNMYGVSTYDELALAKREQHKTLIKQYLLGVIEADRGGIQINEATYDEYVNEVISQWNMEREKALASEPYEDYRVYSYIDIFCEKVEDHCRGLLSEQSVGNL